MTYTVARRTREIGIRMALGAQRRDVLRLIVFNGMLPAVTGLVVGLGGALASDAIDGYAALWRSAFRSLDLYGGGAPARVAWRLRLVTGPDVEQRPLIQWWRCVTSKIRFMNRE